MEKERINKYIASCSEVSRREEEKLILDGKVKLNGKIITELSTQVSENDKIELDGKILKKQRFEYWLFHKPAGYITTKLDEKSISLHFSFASSSSAFASSLGFLSLGLASFICLYPILIS